MRKPLFFLIVLTLWSLGIDAKQIYDTDILTPKADYFTPKNIAFCTQGGGSSHHFWVLEMLKELHSRGHNVSLHTTGDQMVFGKDYPMVETFQLGKHDNFIMDMVKEGMLDHPMQHEMAFSTAKHATKQYIRHAHKKYLSSQIYTINKPSANDESIYTRLFNKLYVPYYLWKSSHPLRDVFKFQRQLGFEPSVDTSPKRYNKVTKMINNAFGLELSREMGQLLHMVGPILRTSYPNLDEESKDFLSKHKRTVYVAFGQHVFPSKEDVHIVLYNLLKLKNEGLFDGIIWVRLDGSLLPEKFEIATGNSSLVISKSDILSDPDILMLNWAPQYAILQHPSTIFFVGHGGAGSIHEGLYSRVPLFVYPFFADQPYNGYMVKRLGVGEHIDTVQMKFTKKNYKILYERLLKAMVDSDGKIKNAVDRYANFLQISSKNSIQRGSDILEECIFSSNDQGHLEHRQDIKNEIGWIKRHSIDLYVVSLVFVGLLFALISKLALYYLSISKKKKIE
ncbi:glycosyltransferase family 1 protein [Backusella circina FSU 941]|nr:glycosyltransferase family 1 protein [Backusella circina FSU 941]